MLSLPFFSMMISERRVFFLQFIWYKIIFRSSSLKRKTKNMRLYGLLLCGWMTVSLQAQQIHDWENHHVLQINREPARAAFVPFAKQKGDCSMSLDGMWKFRWTPVPSERITDFYRTDFNDKDWKDFPVPANWEINGYGTPIYVSAGYPFK